MDVTYKLFLNPVHGVQSEFLRVVKSKSTIRNIPIRVLPYILFALIIIYGTALATVWDSKWQSQAHFFNLYAFAIAIYLAEILWVHRNFDGIVNIIDSTVFVNQTFECELLTMYYKNFIENFFFCNLNC